MEIRNETYDKNNGGETSYRLNKLRMLEKPFVSWLLGLRLLSRDHYNAITPIIYRTQDIEQVFLEPNKAANNKIRVTFTVFKASRIQISSVGTGQHRSI